MEKHERPDSLILTISESMYKPYGYRRWLHNFKQTMQLYDYGEGMTYWLRIGAQPTRDKDLQFVYLCIGGEIRYKVFYAGCQATPEGFKTLYRGHQPVEINGKYWIVISGPLTEVPKTQRIKKQGFRGFRYALSTELF